MAKLKKTHRFEPSYLLLIATPFLSMLLLCVLFRTNPFAIDPVAMDWNDEIGYYKAAQTMMDFGAPQGCTGYNESLGANLSYDAWVPTIFVPYALFGRLFGWGHPVMAMMCNVFLTVLANGVFLALVRPDRRTCLWLCFFSGLYLTNARYIWSGMSEPLFSSYLIMALGLIWWLSRHPQERSVRFWAAVWAFCLLTAYFGTMRPYYWALYLLPTLLTLVSRRPGPFGAALLCGGASLVCYVWLNGNYCSPYMEENVMVDMPSGLAGWVSYLVGKNGYALGKMVEYARTGGIQAVVTFLFLAQALLLAGWWFHIRSRQGSWVLIGFLVAFAAIYEGMALFYLPAQNHRHLMGACLIMGYLFCLCAPAVCLLFQQGLAIFLSVAILGSGVQWLALPQATELSRQWAQELPGEFAEAIQLQPNTDPWANTVAYALDAPYQPLYFLPSGVAISYCRSDYITHRLEEGSLKSKYVYLKPGSTAQQLCQQNGWPLILETEQFLLYENPHYEANALA